MRFQLDDLTVHFPYDYVYPEQYAYMRDLKKSIDAKGHCILEMPSGTGKTISLLALIIAYQQHYPGRRKLVYCSRTIPEIEKALTELKRLMDYREQNGCNDRDFMAIGMTSRKNLCLNSSVNTKKWGKVVDAQCRNLTAPWVREKRRNGEDIPVCDFFEKLEENDESWKIPSGVYTLEDIKIWSAAHGICPYFLTRRMLKFTDVIIYSYHYLLDPKVASLISKDIAKDAIVVFDEAHNIDNVCLESLSIDLNQNILDNSYKSVELLSERVQQIQETNADKLKEEYDRLVAGLSENRKNLQDEVFMANPVLPEDVLTEAIPGNIRKATHFVAFLKRFIEYIKTRMRVMHVIAETPSSFIRHLKEITFIDGRPLKLCSERLSSLVKTLEINDLDQYSHLQTVAEFATLVSSYDQGFILILEPFESETAKVPNPIFHLVCLDPSMAIKPVFDRFSTVVITSGTLSPPEMYPRMLNFTTVLEQSYTMTLTRIVITRGSDQVAVSSKFEIRNQPSVVRNFGNILIEYAKSVPDGIVAFFPSYLYMESIVAMWSEMGILNQAWKHKLIFVETPDAAETSLALENYRLACDNGRGAILLSVARGKVSEGVDFDNNYGRAVLMFGIPYQYTQSRILKARLEFLRDNHGIRENDYLTFDAMRHAAQCVGRVLRGKTDYGLMVFVDKRYSRSDKKSKLPKWIQQYMTDANLNLSTDMAVALSKKFLRTMAQPLEQDHQGISLWSEGYIKTLQAKAQQEALEAAQNQSTQAH
ncbi:DNA repair helicase [Conidiobolus coronatus NRRL 28638]|uniref:DNA 5'-3' helicase n=1 Tax=Conidiobolus coronatus (strain ATCC 28846 / CBS 209.66 / NRRL 28638) TaxID=796925 RepID=A0A137P684_CONC2|nr:DNA repair helicase [Conidiobolus coronatus NRRL 28638]|eukprot:KXN70441.1 DNA repair helicase [Conidiobolus coronatus NRRL 28638]